MYLEKLSRVRRKYADFSDEELVDYILQVLRDVPFSPHLKRAIDQSEFKPESLLELIDADATTAVVKNILLVATEDKESLADDPRFYPRKAALILAIPEAKEAFETLFARNKRLIIKLANRHDESLRHLGLDQADYIQEYFLYLCANIVKCDLDKGKFRDFLIGSNKNFPFLNYQKNHSDNAILDADIDRDPEQRSMAVDALGSPWFAQGEESPAERLMGEEKERRLMQSIEALPEKRKQLIRERFIDGKTPTEIAQERGVTPAAVNIRIKNILATLGNALGDNKDMHSER